MATRDWLRGLGSRSPIGRVALKWVELVPRGHFKYSIVYRACPEVYTELGDHRLVGDIMGKAVRDKPVKDKPLKKSASSSNPGTYVYTYVCRCVCVLCINDYCIIISCIITCAIIL